MKNICLYFLKITLLKISKIWPIPVLTPNPVFMSKLEATARGGRRPNYPQINFSK